MKTELYICYPVPSSHDVFYLSYPLFLYWNHYLSTSFSYTVICSNLLKLPSFNVSFLFSFHLRHTTCKNNSHSWFVGNCSLSYIPVLVAKADNNLIAISVGFYLCLTWGFKCLTLFLFKYSDSKTVCSPIHTSLFVLLIKEKLILFFFLLDMSVFVTDPLGYFFI